MTIDIYFIRHGLAAEPTNYDHDSDRPLTKEGENKTEKIAKQLKKLDIHFDLILTSPYLRAKQTATILQKVGLSEQLEEFAPLQPAGEIDTWLEWLKDCQYENIALVGHAPNLGNWAETLVWGQANNKLVLKKAGIIGVKMPSNQASVGEGEIFWLTPPKFLIF